MSAPSTVVNVESARKTAVLNPYALAELVAGRRINWKQVRNIPHLLEDILQTPYDELFDPKFEGPLYLGFRLNDKLEIEPARSPLFDVEIRAELSDVEMPVAEDVTSIRKLADLGPRFSTEDIAGIPVQRAEKLDNRYIQLVLRVPDRDRVQRLARVFNKTILQTVTHDPANRFSLDFTPIHGLWGDTGRFFNEAAEFFDPIQGNVANCYFIAALSALAWAKPYDIRQLTRATGQNQQEFTNMIRFYRPDSGGVIDREVEVTDRVPIDGGSGMPLYARSSEAGEIWPAVYEKAYAKLLTGTTGDRPDILATAWGDCVWATAQLNGRTRHYYNTADHTDDQLWTIVRANSLSYKTFNPMTAWTYSSGDAAPKKVVYSDGNIVGSHCYTVLGWDYRNGRKYIILRNPWGHTEATVQALNDTVWLYDVSWWRPIDLTVVDGTFAVEASAFKNYWAGIGVAK